jgi:hypothetical protein
MLAVLVSYEEDDVGEVIDIDGADPSSSLSSFPLLPDKLAATAAPITIAITATTATMINNFLFGPFFAGAVVYAYGCGCGAGGALPCCGP